MMKESIAATIGEAAFQHARMVGWTNAVAEACLKQLAALAKPFKYVVTAHVCQRAGAGLHCVAASRWNERTDGMACVRWENSTTLVMASAYWVAL